MVTKLKLYNPAAGELVPSWHVIDAKGKVLGRLSTEISTRLMGKDRPGFVPHLLSGDFVVVINAAKIRVTGNKARSIVYRRHSQHPGNLKEVSFETVLQKFPERVIEHSVKGMLPKNRLGARMLKRLKVYAGEEHPHSAQLTGSDRRLAAIAAGTAPAPVKKALARRRKPKEAEKAAEAPVAEEIQAPEVQDLGEMAVEKPAKKARAAKSSKAPAKSAAPKPSDAKPGRERSSTAKPGAASRSRAASSKSAASRKASSSRASSKSSAGGASTQRTTRPSRSSSSQKSG